MFNYSSKTETPIEELGPLSLDELRRVRHFWRAANFLTLGQLFLTNNPLLHQKLTIDDLKTEIFHGWGTAPGINLVYTHLNRVLRRYDSDVMLLAGPGHGCAALIANTYLEGTYSELYPEVTQNASGLKQLFKKFSHYTYTSEAPSIPGTIQAGFELGHSLAHAFGAVLDNPNLVVCCIVGDGEAETGSISAAWGSHTFLNSKSDGIVLPIIHLNNYKIDAPSMLSRMSADQQLALFNGLGYETHIVAGDNPEEVHQLMAKAMDACFEQIARIKYNTNGELRERFRWPLIVMKTPKGWTGPKILEESPFENTAVDLRFKQFQPHRSQSDLVMLEKWLHSYNIRELFDDEGKLQSELASELPPIDRRMGASAFCNGGRLRTRLDLPLIGEHTNSSVNPQNVTIAHSMAAYVRDVVRLNRDNFRLFGSDGTNSGEHFSEILTVTTRSPDGAQAADMESSSPARLMEILSQDTGCGWLEGYILTGRHGLFFVFLQFSILVSSMINQFCRWLAYSQKVHWRLPISALNIVAVSNHKIDPTGIYHPGFVAGLINQEDNLTNVLLPPDRSTAIVTLETCLKAVNSVNVILIDVSCTNHWSSLDDAIAHRKAGFSIWSWAGSGLQEQPDIVLVCAGQSAANETIRAKTKLLELCPDLNIRVVNIVNLAVLKKTHIDGMTDQEFSNLFPSDSTVVFAYDYVETDIYALLANRHRDLRRWIIRGFCRDSLNRFKANTAHSDCLTLAKDALMGLEKADKSIGNALAQLDESISQSTHR